jgi:4-amino-4-deoxy-L-arabinose transferase-like glycosyltransferase
MDRILLLAWSCFLLKGLFYCAFLPLWEGYDEYAHYDYVQHVASTGGVPGRDDLISLETAVSLRGSPLSRVAIANLPGRFVSFDEYWKLPPDQRPAVMESLRQGGPAGARARLTQYESQQPPLYYYLAAVPHGITSGLSIQQRVMWLRCLNLLLASLIIPVAWKTARNLLDVVAARATVLLLVLIPAPVMTASRVSNEALALVLGSLLVWLATMERGRPARLGLTLGTGLLTKAYFLTSVAGFGCASLWSAARRNSLAPLRAAGITAVAALVVSGFWYAANLRNTGSLSGEQHEVAVAAAPGWALLASLPAANWRSAADSTFVSHIWFGGWSFLKVRSWMYRGMALMILLSLAGVALGYFRGIPEQLGRKVGVLLALLGAFVLGLGYHVLITFASAGSSATTGWYIYSLILAEVLVLAYGLSRLFGGRLSYGLACLIYACAWFAIEAFGLHAYQLPYYSGLTGYDAVGGLPAFQISHYWDGGAAVIFDRLAGLKSEVVNGRGLRALWAVYWVANGLCIARLAGLRRGSSSCNSVAK